MTGQNPEFLRFGSLVGDYSGFVYDAPTWQSGGATYGFSPLLDQVDGKYKLNIVGVLVNGVPPAQALAEDTNLVFGQGNGNAISVTDPDAGSDDLEVTLTATHGVLTMPYTSGLTFTTGDGYGDALMTFTGTLSSINGALEGLTYTPAANYNGSASVQIETDDLAGGTDSDSVSITISAVNDAPVATVPGYQVAYQNGTLVFSTANSNLVSVGDVDNTSLEVTLSVTLGTLTLSGTSGLTFSAATARPTRR